MSCFNVKLKLRSDSGQLFLLPAVGGRSEIARFIDTTDDLASSGRGGCISIRTNEDDNLEVPGVITGRHGIGLSNPDGTRAPSAL